jgi:hypothetical protein
MAFQFARLPFMLVTGPLHYSLYPHVAALRDDKAKLVALLLLITHVLAMVDAVVHCRIDTSAREHDAHEG